MALRLSTGLRNMLGGLNTTKVTNGTFTTDTTGWTASTATLSSEAGGQSGNCLKVLGNGGAGYAANTSAIVTKVGHIYRFSCYFKKGDGTNGRIKVGTAADDATHYDSGNITDATWTKYEAWFIATTTSTYITLTTDANAVYHLYDTVVMEDESASLKDIFNLGEIRIYSGTQPTEADDVPTGTLLCTIKNGANGITFDDTASGVLSKASGETWSGVCGNTGTAGWFRLIAPDDLGTDNTTDARIDGSIATSGGQLNFSSTAFTSGATQTITQFDIIIPAS